MTEVPVQVIVAAYPTPDGASNKMAELQQAKKEGLIHVVDMAVIVKDGGGRLKITNAKHRSTRGFVTGGVVGGLVGLLAGPVGWVALGGGALGALAGKVRGGPLKRELTDLGESLTPNSSAIVAVVEHTWVADLERELAAQDAQVVHDTIKADIAAQLQGGGSVLYSVAGTSAGTAAVREATSPSGTTVGGVLVTDDAVSGVRITETPERASVVGFTSTSAGVTGGAVVVTPDTAEVVDFVATEEGVYVEHATLTQEKLPDEAAAALTQEKPPEEAAATAGSAAVGGQDEAPAPPPPDKPATQS